MREKELVRARRVDPPTRSRSFLFVFPNRNLAEPLGSLGHAIVFHESSPDRVLDEMAGRGLSLDGCHIYEISESWLISPAKKWYLGEPGS